MKQNSDAEEKLFILDLLKMNKKETVYSQECVISIIKQVIKYVRETPSDNYPPEFIRWCITNIAYTYGNKKYVEIEGNVEFETIELIFDYWKNNLK